MNTNDQVLLVDDDEGMCLLIKAKLAKQGIKVTTVNSGKEALNFLQMNRISLMLLDLRLPDITGQELLSILTKRKQLVPFIVVSGTSDVRLIVKLMRLGALDFILKDSAFLDLITLVVTRGLETLESRRSYEESETRLRYISETIRDIFLMIDSKGNRVVFVSPAFEEIWGVSAEQLYENFNSWNEAILEVDRSKVLRSFNKLRDGMERDFDEVYRIRDKSGKIRWIRDRRYANYGIGNFILNFTGVATEITEYKELERKLLEVAEKERLRIGQDLHDDLCQRLAAIGLKCGTIQNSLETDANSQAGPLQAAITELQEATALTKMIAKGLSPVSMEAQGLMEGLRYFTEMIQGRFRVSCQFDCPELVEVTNETTASNIFRIAQELVNNAAKHACPRRIVVGLYKTIGGLRLEVINDGKPFFGPKRRRDGMGLHFVQFRADAIGAALDLFPGDLPDGGTRVVCNVPLKKKRVKNEL